MGHHGWMCAERKLPIKKRRGPAKATGDQRPATCRVLPEKRNENKNCATRTAVVDRRISTNLTFSVFLGQFTVEPHFIPSRPMAWPDPRDVGPRHGRFVSGAAD